MVETKDIRLNPEELSVFLETYFSYYRTLSPEWKEVFVQRIILFTKSKWFVSQKGFKINNQVKAIISASAVQLTLGLSDWRIGYFDTILLFSSDFKNEITGLKLKGETNLNGFVSFSWKSFIEGYRIPDDNLNLGLHEFTHALRFNGVRGHETDVFFDSYFPKWYSYAQREFRNLKNGRDSIFRKYGGANINEFLSVVVEHFFESPHEFRSEFPLLYSATAIMLNQKTDGQKTELNIRHKETMELSKSIVSEQIEIYKGLPPFGSAIVCLIITFVSAFSAGVFSFPTLFTFTLFLLVYAREDFLYQTFIIENNAICLFSGFFIFKNRKLEKITLPQLVVADFFEDRGNDRSVSLTYFAEDDSFYEETAYINLSNESFLKLKNTLSCSYVLVK